VSTHNPPEGEEPVRVRTNIRWGNATATIAIPEVFVYSTGIYFGVDYRTIDVPPPAQGESPEGRQRVADEATERVRTRLRLTDRIRVNGAGAGVIDVENLDRGFTVWMWSVFPAHPDGQPANAALIQLDWPEFPGGDATVPYPPPGSPRVPVSDIPPHGEAPVLVRTYIPPQGEDPVVVSTEVLWQNPTATVTIPEVFFYSTGVYIPVTYRPLAAPSPARQTETEEEQDPQPEEPFSRVNLWGELARQITVNGARMDRYHYHLTSRHHLTSPDRVTFTAWIWIEAGGPENTLHVELNWPEFADADADIAYPPPGSPTAPAPSVPQSWSDHGNNWGQATTTLRSITR
jgi:hypothetical protein